MVSDLPSSRLGLLPEPAVFCPAIVDGSSKGWWHYGGRPPTQRQGWKIYVSFTPFNALNVLSSAIPILACYGVHFKYIRRFDDIYRLNAGALGYSQIGKCLVSYVPEANRPLVQDLIACVADLGNTGPVVPFARALGEGLPLYYRFGSYCDSSIIIDGIARPDDRASYDSAVPNGVDDWLALHAQPSRGCLPFRSFLLNYPVYSSLRQQGKSGIFCGLDIRSDTYREVILKVGYRYGAMQADGSDGRTFVRHEIDIYRTLADFGLGSVAPKMLDSYDDGERVVIVLERLFGDDLLTLKLGGILKLDDVIQAWRLLDRVHRQGFFVGDAKLANFLRDRDGRVWIVDFESAGREEGMRDHRPLRTFELRHAQSLHPSVFDKLHFLASVMFDYEAVDSSGNFSRIVDLSQYVIDGPHSEIEKWAIAHISTFCNSRPVGGAY